MLQILLVTFPFFALVLCGYLAARWRGMPLEAIPGLNSFVLFFALPCLLYRFAARSSIVELLDASVSSIYLVCALVMVTITIAATRRVPVGWKDASLGALAAAFPNSGFMGVPLLVALIGARAAGPAIVCLALDMIVTSSLCIALSRLDTASGEGAARTVLHALKQVATNPLPWSIGLGCIASATGLELPGPAMRTVDLLADGASPVALFTIGAVLARPAKAAPGSLPSRKRGSDVPLLVLCKLIVHPALIFAVGKSAQTLGVPLDNFSLTVLVLVGALPSASNVPMLAERYGGNTARVARVTLVTTAAAFLSFSAAVALLKET
jgi:malonate transporter